MADIVNFDYGKFKIPSNWPEMLLSAEARTCFRLIKKSEIRVGNQVGDLVILNMCGSSVEVKCKCGRTFVTTAYHLRSGHTRRCKDCSRVAISKRLRKPMRTFDIDELCRFILSKWSDMRKRVERPAYKSKQIEVCKEWLEFESFREWCAHFTDRNGINIAIAYCKNMSIDRIDNFGDYAPNNVQFATHEEQANNKSTNINIVNEFGEYESVSRFSRRHQIPRKVVDERAKNGTFDANSIINEYRTDGEQMMLFEPATNHRAKSARR